MLTDYIRAAMRQARYRIRLEDGTYFGEIPGIAGVWANADSLDRVPGRVGGCPRRMDRAEPLGGVELTITRAS